MRRWTVVVPVRARRANLDKLVDALARQTYPVSEWDLVVVDDGSPDPVHLPEQDVFPAKVIRQPPSGPGPARNRGVAEARGQWVAFTAADCEPLPTWLESLEVASRRWPDRALGGAVQCGLADAAPMASHLLVKHLTTHLNRDPNDVQFFTPNNLAVPVEGFHAIGGFGDSFAIGAGEDRDFCARWRESARKLAAVPEASVIHTHPLAIAGLLLQQYRYGRGSEIHRGKQRRRGLPAQFEDARFYVKTLRAPWREDPGCPRAVLIATLLGASLVANAIGAAREWVNGNA